MIKLKSPVPICTTFSTTAEAYGRFGKFLSACCIISSPSNQSTSPDNTAACSAYVLSQSEVETFNVLSLGL